MTGDLTIRSPRRVNLVNFGSDVGEEDKPEGDGRLDCDDELLVLRSGVAMSGDVFEEARDWNCYILLLADILLDLRLSVFSF